MIGASASNSGLLITPRMLGVTIGAVTAGRFIRTTGRQKRVPHVGLAPPAFAFLVLAEITRATPAIYGMIAMTLLGIGLGPAEPLVSIAAQNAVDRRDSGAAMALLRRRLLQIPCSRRFMGRCVGPSRSISTYLRSRSIRMQTREPRPRGNVTWQLPQKGERKSTIDAARA